MGLTNPPAIIATGTRHQRYPIAATGCLKVLPHVGAALKRPMAGAHAAKIMIVPRLSFF